jgi:hypothetical protein
VLELVVRKLPVGFCIVALCQEIEKRLAALVVSKLFIDHLPADRLSLFERRERVTEPRRSRLDPAQSTEFLTVVGMPKADAIPRRFREHPGRIFNALHEPETTAEPQHVAGGDRVVRRIALRAFLAAREAGHNFVRHASKTEITS